ncbi:MAG: HAD family hydrolase, partial [Thermoplasmata archaeon]|nr:HAD family hydrolase [Thermoplasmata archaeon]
MEPPPRGARLVLAESNLRGIKGLTLDAYGALLEGGPDRVPSALSRLLQDRGTPLDRNVLGELWRNRLRKHLRSEPFLTFREVHRRAFKEVFKTMGIGSDVEAYVESTFEEYRTARAYPDVLTAVRDLEQEVPIAVVSNMDTSALLAALLANHLSFTFVVTSDEEQRYKPDPALFRRAVRYLGLPAEHVLHVGNMYAEDIIGASSAGMRSLLIQRDTGSDAQPIGTAAGRVENLTQVRNYIRKSWE